MQKQMQADFQKNPKALPSRTYKDKLSLLTGNDRVELYYFGPGHTNGDSWVVFPALRVVHAGDIFAGKNVPLVDFGNGGSGVRYPETLTNAYNGLNASVDTIITGHANTTLSMADLKQYAAFNADFLLMGTRTAEGRKVTRAGRGGIQDPRHVSRLRLESAAILWRDGRLHQRHVHGAGGEVGRARALRGGYSWRTIRTPPPCYRCC